MQSKQQKKRRLRIGALTVRTLLQAGKLENFKEEMRSNKVDVMGISEVRWQQSGELISDKFRMFYSSGDAKGSHGVVVSLGPHVSIQVRSVRYLNNRMMVVRLQGKKVGLVIVQIYMPSSGVADEVVGKQMRRYKR